MRFIVILLCLLPATLCMKCVHDMGDGEGTCTDVTDVKQSVSDVIRLLAQHKITKRGLPGWEEVSDKASGLGNHLKNKAEVFGDEASEFLKNETKDFADKIDKALNEAKCCVKAVADGKTIKMCAPKLVCDMSIVKKRMNEKCSKICFCDDQNQCNGGRAALPSALLLLPILCVLPLFR